MKSNEIMLKKASKAFCKTASDASLMDTYREYDRQLKRLIFSKSYGTSYVRLCDSTTILHAEIKRRGLADQVPSL